MALSPEFSGAVDLHSIPTLVVTRIVHELSEIAHTMDTLPRVGALWRSLTTQGSMRTVVDGYSVSYVVDDGGTKLVVIAVSPP